MNATARRLVIVSNRVPELAPPGSDEEQRRRSVGGLVSALRPAVEETGGLWLGWSGRTLSRLGRREARVTDVGSIRLVTLDLSESEVREFYTGYCNRTLWPLFHAFTERFTQGLGHYSAYREVNRLFAQQLEPFLQAGDLIWAHDYHLFPLGSELRRLGWEDPIGFFLHIPFPPSQILMVLPGAKRLLEQLLEYDVLGFHTERYAENFLRAVVEELGAEREDSTIRWNDRSIRVGAYPIGTDPAGFRRCAESAAARRFATRLSRTMRATHLVLGVDRLDYTKGIPQRLRAFEHLLQLYPEWRGHVSMVQISVPSRTRVPEYRRQKEEVDRLVGEINGRFSEADWIPIRYLYRSYSHEQLASFYRLADVGLITPIRDGMNLVAKEFIACQSHENPGALVLSRFCGAADELTDAIIVNPFDLEGVAMGIDLGLRMSLDERRGRQERLARQVEVNTAGAWRSRFMADLTAVATDLQHASSRAEGDGDELVAENGSRYPG